MIESSLPARLKAELQGPNGLVNQVRSKYIPSGETLSQKAWRHVSFADQRIGAEQVQRNFNQYLSELVDVEYQLYLSYEETCISKGIIQFALAPDARVNYPSVFNLLNKALGVLNSEKMQGAKKLAEIGATLRPFYKLVEQSFAQSRMTRAGSSSQYHLKTLLEIAGYGGEFQMQQVLNGTVDFLFPSLQMWKNDRRRCVVVSMKRTLRERYKQVFEELKITGGLTVFLIVTETYQEAMKDITPQKVERLNAQNIYLVVRDRIKEERFPTKENVVSFSAFLQEELPAKRTLWQRHFKRKQQS